jgi:SNF2 family DNA or RNA helicase
MEAIAQKSVRIERDATSLRIAPTEHGAFEIADDLYFSHVLSGERIPDSNGFSFDLDSLGQQGVAELLNYLAKQGYITDLDSGTGEIAGRIAFAHKELGEAARIGKLLKRRPESRFRAINLLRKLKPFQMPAVAHMVKVPHAANFSVPGSGKTTITLAAFATLKHSGQVNSLVVIGPRSSFAPWEQEFRTCLGNIGHIVRISGNRQKRIRAWRRAEGSVVTLLNYHVAANDITKLAELLRKKSVMLVLDESHHIKNIAEGKWATRIHSVAALAKKRVILSGTPSPNSLLDLWSQFSFLFPAESPLGVKEQFISLVEKDDLKSSRAIQQSLSPLFWRIRKQDLKLPRPKISKIYVEMGEVQNAIYDAIALRVFKDFEKAPAEIAKLRVWRRAKMIRLLQAASNPGLLTRYSDEFKLPPLAATGLNVSQLIDHYTDYEIPKKIMAAVELVRKITSEGKKVVLWTSFIHNIKMLLRLLKDASPLPLYGGIPLTGESDQQEMNREGIIRNFLSDSSYKILIANPAACAESISLHHACHDAIYLDRTYNCAHFLQSKDRIHRVGLRRTDVIRYYFLIGNRTIDEVIDRRLAEKQQNMLRLLEADFARVDLDSGEDVMSEESDEELDFQATLKQIAENIRHD